MNSTRVYGGIGLLFLGAATLAQGPALPEGLAIATRFWAEGEVDQPRPEYPRPQMVREGAWQSLNEWWGLALSKEGPFARKIRVPFAPESALSGIFLGQLVVENVRYRRTFRLEDAWRKSGRGVWLRFEAVDWRTVVKVNGTNVGEHVGGYGRFGFDITKALVPGPEQTVEVEVFDPTEKNPAAWAPRGKQRGSEGIWYTRTTGIWQSVWLESVPDARIERVLPRGDSRGTLDLRIHCHAVPDGAKLRVRVLPFVSEEQPLAHKTLHQFDFPAMETTNFRETLSGMAPWSPENPTLYTLDVELVEADGRTLDRIRSYVGFRSVGFDDEGRWALNGAARFLVGVLDQGYWPESGMTAPSEAALRYDVELTKALGLNLSRKHTKVEDSRFYYWCDRLGVMVMQDMPSPIDLPHELSKANYLRELEQMVEKVESHPSVVHWVVFNEDWGRPGEFQDQAVEHLRKLDSTRPVTDASRGTQRQNTDNTDIHDYGSDLERHARDPKERPKIIGECGGVAYSLPGHRWSQGWGYTSAQSGTGFVRRIARLCSQLHRTRGLSGFVWTQLSDVEQELNGLVHYDRSEKVAIADLRRALLGEIRSDEPPLFVKAWEILGPIPVSGAPTDARAHAGNRPKIETILAQPGLPGEATLGKVELPPLPSGARLHSVAASSPVVDLRALFPERTDGIVAYAIGKLELPAPAKLTMLFGSDDGARVWIDGKLVHSVARVRGVNLGDDEVEGLELGAGPHHVVIKIVQGVGGMGFACEWER